jgi:hypothetical protein
MITTSKGEIALLKVLLRAAEKGWPCSRPTIEGTRYDLIIDDGKILHRVQVKYANGSTPHGTGSVHLHLSKKPTTGTRPRISYSDDIDALLVYLPATDSIVWLEREIWHGKHDIYLRHTPSKSNQVKGCLFVADHTF